jgi:TrbC/VIRB2 pilin
MFLPSKASKCISIYLTKGVSMSTATTFVSPNTAMQTQSQQWIKAILWSVLVLGCYFSMNAAFAQVVTGGAGAGTAISGRATAVTNLFQTILQGVGIAILTAAFMYVGYGLAWGGKKWGDVANVAYGSAIAGAGTFLVAWLFQ